jgi:hypothetical protein
MYIVHWKKWTNNSQGKTEQKRSLESVSVIKKQIFKLFSLSQGA